MVFWLELGIGRETLDIAVALEIWGFSRGLVVSIWRIYTIDSYGLHRDIYTYTANTHS